MLNRILSGICALFFLTVLSSCGGGSGDGTSSGADNVAQNDAPSPAGTPTPEEVELSKIFLDAFNHFKCSSGWTKRRGGLGRAPYAGSGTCTASFPGPSGMYNIALKAQLEFDGSSPYRISINGNTIKKGNYPYSQGKLVCDCPDHEKNCPDKIIDISAGRHQINKGDSIEFWGDDVYPCGNDTHGSYAIWRGMTFTP